MALTDHLVELRRRMIYCIIAFVVPFLASFFALYRYLFRFIMWPYNHAAVWLSQSDAARLKLLATGPAETFLLAVKASAILGLVVACPICLHQAWLFLRPGLTARERRAVRPVLLAAPLCFLAGSAFGYRVLTPPIMLFFINRTLAVDVEPWFSVNKLGSHVLGITAACGVVFQLPIVVSVLSAIGLVTPRFLARIRKFVALGAFVAAAILTPPDVLSQVMLAIPILLLYEVSILVSRVIDHRRRAKVKADEADPDLL